MVNIKKRLHQSGIKTYRHKVTGKVYVKKSDVAKILAESPASKATYDIGYETGNTNNIEDVDTGFVSRNNKIKNFEDFEKVIEEIETEMTDIGMNTDNMKKGELDLWGTYEEDAEGNITHRQYFFSNLSDAEIDYMLEKLL